MKSLGIIAISSLVLAHGALAQFYEPPPTTADPNTIRDCTWWHVAAAGDTCAGIAAEMGLPVSDFQTYVRNFEHSRPGPQTQLLIAMVKTEPVISRNSSFLQLQARLGQLILQ